MNKGDIMKGRIFSFSIFSLLCIFTLVACGNNSELPNDGDGSPATNEDANGSDNGSNNIFDYGILEVNSVGKKFDSIYSEYEDENNVVLDDNFEPSYDYNTIDSFVSSLEDSYSIYNEKESIESNKDYKISLSLNTKTTSIMNNDKQLSIIKAPTLDDSDDGNKIGNYYIDNVYYGDDEIPYYIDEGNVKLYWNQKDNTNKDFTFVFHDINGKVFNEIKNFNFKIKDKDFSLSNPTIRFRNNILRITFSPNDYSYELFNNYTVMLFENGNIIQEREFMVFPDEITAVFDNVQSNRNYEYVIVENRDNNKISIINWGEIKSNIPYSIVYNDITNNSINVSISNKGTRNITEYVELHDSKGLVEKKDLNNNYVFNNLKSGKDYSLKIYYSYFENNEKKNGYCIKNISTLKNNEELVGIRFDREVINPETDDYFDKEYNWNNGTKIVLKDIKAHSESEKYNIKESSYIRFVLPYDAIVTMKISDANVSGQYEKNVFITDGNNNSISIPIKSNENYYPQSFYLKAGDYKFTSGGGNINIRNIIIKEVMKNNDFKKIKNNIIVEDKKYLLDDQMIYQVGKKFTTYNFRENHYYDNYYSITMDNEYKYYISKNDGSYLSEIKENDVIDTKYLGECTLMITDKKDNLVTSYGIYVYGSDLDISLELYDDITKVAEISRLVTDEFNIDRYKFKIKVDDIEHPYEKIIYLKDNDPSISLSYDIGDVTYNNIEYIDANSIKNGVLKFTYDTEYLGSKTLDIPFTFSTLKIFVDDSYNNSSIYIASDKTEFLGNIDTIDRHISMTMLDNYSNEITRDYYHLNKLFPGLLEIYSEPIEYIDNYMLYHVSIIYNNIVVSNELDIKIYNGNIDYVYDGNYNGGIPISSSYWNVNSSASTRCAEEEGEYCVSGGENRTRKVFAFAGNDYLETINFHATEKISLVIYSGTSSSAKKVYFTVSIFDRDDNVLESEEVLGTYDKILYRNVVDFDLTDDVYKIRIDNVTSTAEIANIGILRIEVAYI